MNIYFDNTASTPLAPEVTESMFEAMKELYGNPSSVHYFGRSARVAIENSRKLIAGFLEVNPAEIVFTSGGTEANNMAIRGAIQDLGCRTIITSRIEHHAVLHTAQYYAHREGCKIVFVNLSDKGLVDYAHLEQLLSENEKCFVSLMHANNEISNLLDIKRVSALCEQYDAWFHSDMVQTMGHYKLNLKDLGVHFASCSGHKFHGPKGAGILYINKDKVRINSLLHGGGQERNMRGGTESIYGIVGLGKAFEIAHAAMEEDTSVILALKNYMIASLLKAFPDVRFLGESAENGLYTILSVQLPATPKADMMLMILDSKGIAASGGSACTSGAQKKSHVADALGLIPERPVVRFSFSKYNQKKEIDFCISVLKEIYSQA